MIKKFIIESILKNDIPDLLPKIQSNSELGCVLDKLDVAFILGSEPQFEVPDCLIKSEIIEINKRSKCFFFFNKLNFIIFIFLL